MTEAEHRAWRDSYLYGKRDGSEGAAFVPRGGNAEAYRLGFAWGQRHPVSPFRLLTPGGAA